MSVIMSRPAHDPKYAGAEKENAAGVAAAKTVMSYQEAAIKPM